MHDMVSVVLYAWSAQCRFIQALGNEQWIHGGYWLVCHTMDASIFINMLRTRCLVLGNTLPTH